MTTLEARQNQVLKVKVDTTNVPNGSTVYFTAKRKVEDLDSAAVLAGSNTVNTNTTTIIFAASAMAAIPAPSTLFWDVQTFVGGEPWVLDSGYLRILPAVRRAVS